MSMKYVRTGFRTRAEHIHLGNPLALYTAVGYRWPWARFTLDGNNWYCDQTFLAESSYLLS